jgi:6-pyruvoyltetrahydropterin/6-carboxytetrahydropterin synthase
MVRTSTFRLGFTKRSPNRIFEARGSCHGARSLLEILPFSECQVSDTPHVTITRRLQFNAAHRVHNPALSEEENRATFGKCNNPNWHGHNYTLDVSVRGPVDQRTGYVVDLGKLKAIVEREVIDKVDHRNFNLEVDFMAGTIPTTENIVVAMWRVLLPAIAPGHLSRLTLWETPNNYVEYDGT